VLAESAAPPDAGELVVSDCGVIEQVTLLRAQLTFSPVVEGPAIDILGTTIPPGDEFHVIFLDPEVDALHRPTGAPVVATDVAIELTTSRGRTITFFTRGVGHFIQVAVDAGLPPGMHARRHSLH
jgi:hypothetical protein